MKNQNIGRSWNAIFNVKKNTTWGMLQAAYNYGESKNTVDPGSIAFGSWSSNEHSGDPNNPGLAFADSVAGSSFLPDRHLPQGVLRFRCHVVLRLLRDPVDRGFTDNFVFAGDLNGDVGTANDLLYIHRNVSEMNFSPIPAAGAAPAFTPEQQAAAWEALIAQDPYLSQHRGEYAQRGAVFLPMVKNLDFSVTQDVFATVAGDRQRFQFRVDIVNFGNLLNKNWGVGQRLVSNQPLTNPAADAQGRATYRLRVINNQLMTNTLEQTAGINDVYRVMFSLKYFFGS